MPSPTRNTERSHAINKLAAEANLVDVADWLGFQVIGRGTRSPKILCPFHEDRRPSMQLYSGSGSGRAQFHCFACGAHGDVFDLIKRHLSFDFRGAVEWLAERYRVVLPISSNSSRGVSISPRARGLESGLAIYRRQTAQETAMVSNWALERKLGLNVIQTAEIYAAIPQKISKSRVIVDREQIDSLDAAGLLVRGIRVRTGESSLLPIEAPARDFYSSPRILFTIRDDRGAITGFAGRAIGSELPKYLFSPGFPRGSTLYRLHKVRAERPRHGSRKGVEAVHVFVVEGLMDALRLESRGFHSVAIFGSQITVDQVALLKEYARDLDRDGVSLVIHLMLDADEAGRRGAVSATVKLLEASLDASGLMLDVIIPFATGVDGLPAAHDPDEIFREIDDPDTVRSMLSNWCCSPMRALLAAALDTTPSELDLEWKRLSEGQRLQAFRDVERRMSRSRWIDVMDRLPAFEQHLRASAETADWEEALRRFLRVVQGRPVALGEVIGVTVKDDESRLIRALQIAEASTQRREFPVDEGSWDRLQSAVDVTIPHLRSLLENANDRFRLDADAMLSVLVPKGENKYRLKALPSPEILSLQQYVMNEMLREYVDCPRFSRFVPGVRFALGGGSKKIETTGPEHLVPVNGETVSFAYMLDMDVIEHRAPP